MDKGYQNDPEPQPEDGPDYHIDHAFWLSRHPGVVAERARQTIESQILKWPVITQSTTRATTDEAPVDLVNHPPHYNSGPKCSCGKTIECIDVTRHQSLLRGTAMKYLWRADYKGSREADLKKAIWYIQKELDTLDEW